MLSVFLFVYFYVMLMTTDFGLNYLNDMLCYAARVSHYNIHNFPFSGGELFSQRFEGYTLHVTALFEQVVVSWARPFQEHQEVALDKKTLDNQWHWLALKYKPNPPSLLLEVDKETQVRYF